MGHGLAGIASKSKSSLEVSNQISEIEVEELARYARIFRSDDLYQFSADTKSYLKKILLNKLVNEPIQAENSSQVTQKAKPSEIIVAEPQKNLKELRVELRSLIEANAQWEYIETCITEIRILDKDPSFAASACELSMLHAPVLQMVSFVEKLSCEGLDFYILVHEKIREQLILKLWERKKLKLIAKLVFSVKKEAERLPVEHLFSFLNLVSASCKDEAFMYFQRHETALTSALGKAHESKVYSIDRFYYTVGQLSVDAGFIDSARRFLEYINPKAPEYSGALQLLLNLNLPVNQRGFKKIVAELDAQRNWQDKIAVISGYLYECRRLGGIQDKNRPALNALFKDPLKFVPSSSEAWVQMSQLILGNLDLVSLIPNLPRLFFDNASKYHPEKLDLAIWRTVKDYAGLYGSKLGTVIKGMAELHYYVYTGPLAERSLWLSKDYIEKHISPVETGLNLTFRSLLRDACGFVRKNPAINEKRRDTMLRQMSICVDPDSLLMSDIYEYIKHSDMIPYHMFEYLQKMTQKKSDAKTESYLIQRKSSDTHYKNVDLNRLFQISIGMNEVDLSWRVATVLNARKSLKSAVETSWKISGERRSEYGVYSLSDELLVDIFTGLDEKEAKLWQACLGIGPILPEFLSYLDKGTRAVKAEKPDRMVKAIDHALAQSTWITVPTKIYRFSIENPIADGLRMPVFAEMMPASNWCRVVSKVYEVLGVYAWGCRLSTLRSQLDMMLPQGSGTTSQQYMSYKAAKWIRNLSPLQRKCWKDLIQCRDELSDELISLSISKLVIRIATALYPAHFEALTSLQKMRAPIELHWDLEKWILSDAYSRFREKKGIKTRVNVPAGCRGLGSIVKD